MSKRHALSIFGTFVILVALIFSAWPVGAQERDDLCIDMSTAYDRNFKWYNTAGPLPFYMADHYLFTGGKDSPQYQDAISLKPIRVGESFALSARVAVNIQTLSLSSRDEFSVFITDDTKVFTGDEFGFIIRQNGPTLSTYLQSPLMTDFFTEFNIERIPLGQEKTYTLKAVYSELDGKAIVRFFVNDIHALTHSFPLVNGHEFFLVVSSKKLSEPTKDTSGNTFKVYSACIVNLPVADTPSNTDAESILAEIFKPTFLNIVMVLFMVATLITTINIYRTVQRQMKNHFV